MHRRVAVGVAVALCAASALAQPTPTSHTATLRDAVESAWQHRLAAHASQDRIRRAKAAGIAASSWLADAPALELAARSDRWGANQGGQEREVGIRLPLWLPGQRTARVAAAEAELAWAEATQAADKLKLAGEVRERGWELAAALASLRQAEAQAQSIKSLAEDAARRLKAGEIARADLFDLQAEASAAQSQVHETRAKLAAAQAQWSSLTGQPAAVDPVEVLRDPGADAHPALLVAELMVERASRALDDVRRSSREAPELGIGLRQERGERNQPLQASVAVGLRWSFGTDARNEPRHAAALGEVEAARADAATLRQQLVAERSGAAAALVAAEAQLGAARERADLLQRREALVDAAFKAGEISLPDRLRARAAAAQSVTAVAQQQAAFGLARARMNQTLGILP